MDAKVDNSAGRGIGAALDRLCPPFCIVCGARGEARGLDLCGACMTDLPVLGPACDRCGVPLHGESSIGARCGRCLRRRSAIDATYCAYRYAWPVDHLLRALKYRHALSHARVFGILLATRLLIELHGERPDVLCPVPLGPRRYAERGFNQALEIGRVLETRLRVPMRTDLLERWRDTVEQTQLDGRARRRNVRAAFATRGSVKSRHIALLDDVVTTGSTVEELARVLRRAGARRIEVWAVARAAR